MCGIAGYITSSQVPDLGRTLRAMASAIAHRGPDAQGFLETSSGQWRIGLAHRRLSIIDLSTGQQPLGNEDGSVQVVFNGEIYNFQTLRDNLLQLGHTFATHSDTEVIVHAYEEWGPECVSRFRGMFSFVLWDSHRQRVMFARDRFGKKPLYIQELPEQGVLFASEIKALLCWPNNHPEIDQSSLWDYFTFRYAPGPKTLFRGIRKLTPGSYALWENGKLSEVRYAYPPDRAPLTGGVIPQDPVGAFMAKLDEAVQIRMVADVPFGAFLSGGLDSSAVVALMSRHSAHPVKTFSVGFNKYTQSELGYAKTIADFFKTDHNELTIDPAHVIDHLSLLTRFRDAPVAEPSDVPIYLLSREAGKSVKMVLTGEGADEFLGGYPKYVMERYASIYQRVLPRCIRRNVLEPLVMAGPAANYRIKTAVASMGLECFEERMPRWFGALSYADRNSLIARHGSSERSAPYPGLDSSLENSALRRAMYFDQSSWLPDNLLERGDSMTMAASIESRMPFMDHELANYVSSLPDSYRICGKNTKWLLRKGMETILPISILARPKVGFRVPVQEWFRTSLRDYVFDHLTSINSITRTYFHQPVLNKFLEEHMNGIQNHEKLIWSLISLEIWHREYFA